MTRRPTPPGRRPFHDRSENLPHFVAHDEPGDEGALLSSSPWVPLWARVAQVVACALLLVGVGYAGACAREAWGQPAPSSVGAALSARGYRASIWVERFDEQRRRYLLRGIFHPEIPCSNGGDCTARYGQTGQRVNGSLAGERCAGSWTVGDQQGAVGECIARHLGLPAGYRGTPQDINDLAYVQAGAEANACDVLERFFPCQQPAPVPTSSPPPPQPSPTAAPPAPTPVATPSPPVCPPQQPCPVAALCRPGVRVVVSEACLRAWEQLKAGKKNGPLRTQGIAECPIAKINEGAFAPGVLSSGQNAQCLAVTP